MFFKNMPRDKRREYLIIAVLAFGLVAAPFVSTMNGTLAEKFNAVKCKITGAEKCAPKSAPKPALPDLKPLF